MGAEATPSVPPVRGFREPGSPRLASPLKIPPVSWLICVLPHEKGEGR